MGLFGVLVTVAGVIAATIFVFVKACKDTLLYGKIRNVCELLRMLMVLKSHAGSRNGKVWSYVDEFERKVDTEPDVTQFIFVESEEHITRSALDRRANQMAHWARSLEVDLRQHDTVAFMMQNCPDFVAFWLGVSKVMYGIQIFSLSLSLILDLSHYFRSECVQHYSTPTSPGRRFYTA